MAGNISIIGDPHGCVQTLQRLLNKLPEGRKIIIGDIIDRGPGSYRCFELVRDQKLEMVLGNHEYMFLQRNEGRHLLGLWLNNGGDEAMEDISMLHPEEEGLRKALAEMDSYFQHLPDRIEVEADGTKLLLSHAGVEDYVWESSRHNLHECFTMPYDNPRGFLWARGQLANIPGMVQVVGHTPTPNGPTKDKYGNWYIDTGCFMKNKEGYGYLSALVFSEGKLDNPEIVTQQNVEEEVAV